ncbi:uncharacterized protein PG986_011385 [Apiospora aurea]|uniref:UBC core domain-containing protein n=1 Tax=Apiospora aurea TaxID=335848 RepID=A0ABR1Q5N0_9PEZI
MDGFERTPRGVHAARRLEAQLQPAVAIGDCAPLCLSCYTPVPGDCVFTALKSWTCSPPTCNYCDPIFLLFNTQQIIRTPYDRIAAMAMAEVAGLALGVLGIAGLFTSCIENFDIFVRAKDFGDFDHLCTRLSLERVRLALWGETLGLLPSWPDQKPQVPYNHAIDREDIQPSIVACLCQLLDLLTKANVITERYALDCTPLSTQAYSQEVTQTPRGMLVLRDSFQKFKERIRKNQKQKPVWKVTRWSIHDCAQFEALVDKVHKLLDGLESITNALGVLERQRERLLEEVDSESDAQSLSLLQDIGSADSAPAALRASGQTGSNHGILSIRQKSLTPGVLQKQELPANQSQNDVAARDGRLEGHRRNDVSVRQAQYATPNHKSTQAHESIPQHRRWVAALLASRPQVQHAPVFSPGGNHYGQAIRSYKASDDQNYRNLSGRLAVQVHTGVSLAQRVFIELRNIHRAAVPFISASPVGDALDKLLACIEGPPGTPYQSDIFWITVRISESQPPTMQFHTHIYHPTIDHAGKICADYMAWWQRAMLVALCGLLANPNVEDPLVPKIAEKFVTDYDRYCGAARLYTQRYASAPRPAEEDLVFSHDSHATGASTHYEASDLMSKAKTVTSSVRHTDAEGSVQDDHADLASTKSIFEDHTTTEGRRSIFENLPRQQARPVPVVTDDKEMDFEEMDLQLPDPRTMVVRARLKRRAEVLPPEVEDTDDTL